MAKRFYDLNPKKNNYILRANRIFLKYKDIIVRKDFTQYSYEIDLNIRPTLESNNYVARIEKRQGIKPKIFILKPNLYEITNGNTPPHIYEFTELVCRICLYLPKTWNEYSEDSDIIPWISEWLFHFEIWLITGKWNGGGHE